MKDPTISYGAMSYWHDTAPMRPASRRVEPGRSFDVVILGGGYTGLWTAYHLLHQDPSLAIAVLEKEEVGFGASGRNGGFAMSKIGPALYQLVGLVGEDATRALHQAGAQAVRGLAAAITAEGIDCDLRYGGLITVATNEAQERKIHKELAVAERLHLADFRLLDGAEVRSKVDSPTYRMGVAEEHCAVLHPARLARGLADVLVRKSLTLYERAGVAAVTDEHIRVRIDTSAGPIYAAQVVIATNAWAAHDRAFQRSLIPMYTYIIATEPISADDWAKIGWRDWHGMEDKRVHLHYYRRTEDGRILWGGHYNVSTFRSGIDSRHDRNERIFGMLRASFAETFPQLSQVPFTHGWGGPIAVTPDFMPKFGSHSGRVHYGWGYCGHGVAPSYLAGQVLRDLVLGRETEFTALPCVNKPSGKYPFEPVRFIGSYLTRRESLWYDDNAGSGARSSAEPRLLRLASRLFAR
jgi:glycine/D-amino acid oxidase-like deaminating enzyme